MNALTLAEQVASAEGLQLFPIRGDSMEPTFYRGDFALVRAVDRWDGEGCYVLDLPFGPVLYRVAPAGGMARLMSDNERYSTWEMPRDDLLGCLLAKAVFKLNVMDRRLVPDALRF
ncbi:S24 family peptidase [Enterovirga rhinocerotis]|uniref:S24 family peptidase n=1 Tax=Enterovirga rhinocerotis TaxID=1339210 RepID=UPI00105DA688|nr:S24 family peptidase [Enterovirga rhinocerotis]